MTVPEALRALLNAPDPLLRSGDHILVAVSGGPDSLALLHVLDGLRTDMGLRGVSAAHLHHGLRGQEADDDAAFVAQFCAARAIPCFTEKADVAREAAREHVAVQQAARTVRYAFLARTARQCRADKVATAHTQDDLVETVLMHIMRGTGLDGLRGIPARRGIYVRPLLNVTHAQAEAYCDAHALQPRRDSSNSDSSHYTRNRIRRELLPMLETDYHPGTRASLLRLAQIAGADADFLQGHAQAMLHQITLAESALPQSLTLSRVGLRALHPALLRHVLRAALAQTRGTGENITYHHLEQMADALRSSAQTPWGMTTPAPLCRVVVRAQTVVFTMQDGQAPLLDTSYSVPLPIGGSAQLPGSRQQIKAKLLAPAALPAKGRDQAAFDAEHVHLPSLHVRTWQPGDRLAPRGMNGHTQKVQDVFANAKVPRQERSQTPIAADRDGLLWVAGLAASERGRLTQATKQCLVLCRVPTPATD